MPGQVSTALGIERQRTRQTFGGSLRILATQNKGPTSAVHRTLLLVSQAQFDAFWTIYSSCRSTRPVTPRQTQDSRRQDVRGSGNDFLGILVIAYGLLSLVSDRQVAILHSQGRHTPWLCSNCVRRTGRCRHWRSSAPVLLLVLEQDRREPFPIASGGILADLDDGLRNHRQ